ncbi:MAG: ABC transporter ATP-binding protein, partial [Desulfobacteraceae bacterium]
MPLYQIKELKHWYNDRVVLDIDALTIYPGSIVGLVGPNGSGKSTLLRLLAFTTKPSSGAIEFQGKTAEPFMDRVRYHVTLLPQDPYLMKRSVYRNIAYGLKLRGKKKGIKAHIHEALAQVGLPGEDFEARQWNELSGGEAQRVALAARLALKPEVLLMDEPTANVDIYSSQLIKTAALKARQQHGTTLIIASHDREWLDEICDDLICLFRGRITGKDRDNIVFGSWKERGDNHCEKILADGQVLVLPSPARLPAVACIDPDAIRIISAHQDSPTLQPYLRCIITRLTIIGNMERTMVSLRVGDLSLSARCDSKQIETQSLYPGKTV